MRSMMKSVCLILCLTLLCSVLPMGVFVAAAKENVIFSFDFEDCAVGEGITQDRANVNGWYTLTIKQNNAPLIVQSEKGRGNYAYIENISDAASGPKLMKMINLGALTNLRVSYECKGNRYVGFSMKDDAEKVSIKTKAYTEWTSVVVDIDVENAKFTTTIGGEVTQKDVAFSMFADPSQIQFEFGGSLSAGEYFYIDNVKITTTDDITAEAAQSAKTAAHPANQKYIEAAQKAQEEKLNVQFESRAPAAISVPEGQNYIVLEDFEGYGEVLKYDNWSIVGNKTYVNPAKEAGNQFVAISNTDREMHTPRFNRPLKNLNLNTMTFELDFAANPALDLIVYVKNADKSVQIARPGETYGDGKWHHLKAEVNFKDKKFVSYIDGAEVKSGDLVELMTADAWKTMEIQISAQLGAGAKGRLDNTVAYTPDSVANAVFDYQNNINWDMVKTDNPTGYTEIVREEHPRLIINDWDVIREKIKNDYWCGLWWQSVKNAADSYIRDNAMVPYRVNERGNIQETSQDIRIKSYVLSFVAGVTGERKYAEHMYKILKDVHDTFPDWSENLALLSANFIGAYAYAYDWAYHVFTPEERADVLRMTINRGVSIAVQGYENKLAEAYMTMMNRGNNQSSTANRANICLAVAIATEYPQIAEYLLDNASKGLPNVFAEFFPDGAFIETTDYWDASATDVMQAIAVLESGAKEGAKLPERLDWANTIPGFVNTGDFPIYYSGATASFNYGDTTSRFISSTSFLYLSARWGEPKYAWYEMTRNQVNSPFTTRRIPFAIAWYDPANAVCSPGEFPLDKFYQHLEDGGVNGISMRSSWEDEDMLFVAMQGGDNGAMHQNPSLGTFVMDYAGKRWFMLTGKNSLTGTYTIVSRHDGDESEIWHERTESNNTLIINPDKTAGQDSDAFAPLVRYDTAANAAYGILDISDAREDIQKWERGVMLYDNRERVIIRDEITMHMPSEINWFGHTNAQIDIAADGQSAMMTIDDAKMYVRLNEAPAGAVLAVRDISPLPTSPNPPAQHGEYLPEHSGDKTLYVKLEGVTNATIELEFIPIKDGFAVPSDTPARKTLANWSVEESQPFTAQALGNAVALKLGTPVSFAKGQRTYVDKDNMDVVPFTENSRTLVPVRYIAESFGATVGWNDATQAVTVDYLNKHIELQIGSNQMLVNGQATTLDVVANTYNSRTFIPLRALVEALGKVVLWDDRGLIVISDMEMGYSAQTLTAACAYLDIRIFAGDDEIAFDPAKTTYYLKGAPRAIRTLQNNNSAVITVTDGQPATVTIDGKVYTFYFES